MDPRRSPAPPFGMSDATARPVLDPADLCLGADFAARHGVPVRHVLLASLVCLLRRHAELGPATLALDLSTSFPSSFPDAAPDIFPFNCPVLDDQATPFSHVLRAAAAAEAAALAASTTAPRTFLDRVIPYRVRVTLPPGWGGAPAAAALTAPSSTVVLSVHPDDGLVIAPAAAQAPLDGPALTPFRRLRPILQGAAANPDCPVARLPLLTPAERHQLLVEWNDTRSPLPPFRCAHQLVEAQVARTPDATAVRFRDRALTYRQLDEMANRLARDLQSRGVGPDALVGICLDRSIEMLVAVLATLKAGGAYLPLDPNYPPDRLAFMLDDSAAAVVITRRPIADRLRARTLLCLDEEPVHLYQDVPATAPDCRATADSLCYVIYTSGSTGRPKGVQIPHRAFVNFLASMATTPGVTDRDVLLAVTTLSFDIAGLELILPLTVGARIELLPREVATDGPALRRALESAGATLLQATPATWRMLLSAGWQGTPGLRMLCGADALPRELARQLLARGAELWNVYGPTETTVWSTLHRADGDASPVPIGRPIANTRCYVLDPHLQPVPVGLAGELHIAGDGLARGYLNRPDLTAERFIPDPFSDRPGARLYRTGDVCRYRPDGQIEYLGRNDHQVKINGFRIELGEVEDALLRLPGIRQACCASRDTTGSGGGTQLVAYVVPADPASSPEPADVRRALRGTLPAHMIPVAVIALARFPLTPSGKVDRDALATLPPLTAAAARRHVPPRDDTEARLVDIWKGVLRIDRVGVTDDFFEVGGNSLLAVALAVQIERQFGRPVVVADLLPSLTIESLGTLLRSPASDGAAATARRSLVVPLHTDGTRPPLFCLPGIGGHCFAFRELIPVLGPDQPLYGLNLPGTDGRQEPGREIRAIAARLLDEIRAVQPDGPYYLAGYSFGGTIAYEIALQLRTVGQTAAVVVLLDAFGPGYPRTFGLPARLCRHASRLLLGPPGGRSRYVAGRLRWVASRVAAATGHRHAAKSRLQDVLSAVAASSVEAERGYDYPCYDGPVALFRAMAVPDLAGRAFDDIQNGWGAVVGAPITLIPVACNHFDLLHPDHLRHWGRDLRDLLRRAQSA